MAKKRITKKKAAKKSKVTTKQAQKKQIPFTCVNAVCKFEVAVMYVLAISWAFTFLIYFQFPPYSLQWFAWLAMFVLGLYWAFHERANMKKELGR